MGQIVKVLGAKAHHNGIKAFSETDFTEDLQVIDVPTLVMHSDDGQIVPIAESAPLSVKLLKKGILKVYEKFPHGTVHDARRRDQPRLSRLHQGLNRWPVGVGTTRPGPSAKIRPQRAALCPQAYSRRYEMHKESTINREVQNV